MDKEVQLKYQLGSDKFSVDLSEYHILVYLILTVITLSLKQRNLEQ
jgi:hypothetical protein